VFIGGAHLWSQTRRDFLVPDIPGFITLKGDFHIHTTTSDGEVLPAVRVREAWRDGLDVIALTDHIEVPPPSPDPQPDWNRPYDIAKPVADQYGVLLVRAAEITSSMPPGHINAFFLDDVTRLKQPTVMAGLAAAAEQGAFIIWNHPGWKALQPDVTRWFPRWLVEVAITIHYYEAILACLAIVVWHFYHVIFDPDVYPLNWACWNGKVSKHWQEEEHPLDPTPEGKCGAAPAEAAVPPGKTPGAGKRPAG
jgi:hypothetical protein